jgi:hypothetical protein
MAAIDKAVEAVKAHGPLVKGELLQFAKIYGVDRSTLGRRVRGRTGSRTQGYQNQQKLSPPQELELVNHIEELTVKGLPPTRTMVRNMAAELAHEPVGEGWVTRFLHRHHDHLISKYTTGMDRVRHQADSGVKYREYFNLLHRKVDQYGILPGNTYNMDEKGFLLGVIGRTMRIFSRSEWEKGSVREAIQDGSRTFLTVIACICGDGTTLPPGLIYESTSGAIRANWVEELNLNDHQLFITTSLSG